MWLIAALVLGGMFMAIDVSIRCTWFPIEMCERAWAQVIREWIGETLPVLVAIAIRQRDR